MSVPTQHQPAGLEEVTTGVRPLVAEDMEPDIAIIAILYNLSPAKNNNNDDD